MAYCKQCGAYIPDGQAVCLACGFDEAASAASAAAQEQPRSYATGGNNELRDQLERHRQEQKEKSQRWAEEQYARRQQQESNRQWAQEEYARRKAEQLAAAEEKARAEQQRRAAGTVYRSMGSQSASGNKLLGALSYLSILFILPYIFTPDDGFAKYHAKQGLKLFIFSIIADAIGGITGFGWVLSLLRFYFIYKGMTNALNGREEPLPYIGTIGDR